MKVGVPTEIKTDEYRVSLTPAGVRELVEHGHEVLIQSDAGVGSTIPDGEYTAQGARILPDASSVFEESEMILGVKEPQPEEVEMLRPDHLLFTYLHLAPAPELTKGLVESGRMRAPCAVYSSSGIVLPTPAPDWISTSCPCSTSSLTPAGVRDTRYSSVLISVGTPTFIDCPLSLRH